MTGPWDPALLWSDPNCMPPPLPSLAVNPRLFPQLFKSSPYLKDSIKPWLSHSPRWRSLHFKVAAWAVMHRGRRNTSHRDRKTELDRHGGNLGDFSAQRWLKYSLTQAGAVHAGRHIYMHMHTYRVCIHLQEYMHMCRQRHIFLSPIVTLILVWSASEKLQHRRG